MAARTWLTVTTSLLLSGCGVLLRVDSLTAPEEADAALPAPDVTVTDSGRLDAFVPPQRRPPEGTYTYRVKGSDVISAGPLVVPANYASGTVTIVHVDGGCFDQLLHIRADYDETMRLCLVKEPDLARESFVHRSSQRGQRFTPFNYAATTQTCTPGDVYFNALTPAGKTWPHDCVGRNTNDAGESAFETKGTYRFVGREDFTIFGTPTVIPVLHFVDERVVTDAQTGTNSGHWYFSAEDGLLVRLTRSVTIKYGGIANYTETLDMTLSVVPDGGVR